MNAQSQVNHYGSQSQRAEFEDWRCEMTPLHIAHWLKVVGIGDDGNETDPHGSSLIPELLGGDMPGKDLKTMLDDFPLTTVLFSCYIPFYFVSSFFSCHDGDLYPHGFKVCLA